MREGEQNTSPLFVPTEETGKLPPTVGNSGSSPNEHDVGRSPSPGPGPENRRTDPLGIVGRRAHQWNFGAPVTLQLQSHGGSGAKVWSATGLPPGISLNGSLLQGTPTRVGEFPFTVAVRDAAAASASIVMTAVVADAFELKASICEKNQRRVRTGSTTAVRTRRTRAPARISCRDIRALSAADRNSSIPLGVDQLIKITVTGNAPHYTWRVEGTGVELKRGGSAKSYLSLLSSQTTPAQRIKVIAQNGAGQSQEISFSELVRLPDPCASALRVNFPESRRLIKVKLGEPHQEQIIVEGAKNPDVILVKTELFTGTTDPAHEACHTYYHDANAHNIRGSAPWNLLKIESQNSPHHFSLIGQIRYDVPLGPEGHPGCDIIFEKLTFEVIDRGCADRKRRVVRELYIDYPKIEPSHLKGVMEFQVEDTDEADGEGANRVAETSMVLSLKYEEIHLDPEGNEVDRYENKLGYVSNQIFLHRYGDGGGCHFGEGYCFSRIGGGGRVHDHLDFRPYRARASLLPLGDEREESIDFDMNKLSIGGDTREAHFRIRKILVYGRYWYAILRFQEGEPRGPGGDEFQHGKTYSITWNRRRIPTYDQDPSDDITRDTIGEVWWQ